MDSGGGDDGGLAYAADRALSDAALQGQSHGDVEVREDGDWDQEEQDRGQLVHRVALKI